MSCHLKRGFGRSDFLLKYHQNPQVLKRWSIEKKRKKEEKEEKGKRTKKAPSVCSNKRGTQYFERRKGLQLQRFFLM
jgi:hypothetical protein